MDFRVRGLDYEPFAPLFALSEDALRANGTVRRIAPPGSTYPCRVSLRHAAPGETVILTNFVHLADAASPYRSLGPIFVRRGCGSDLRSRQRTPASAAVAAAVATRL